jgi:hypothetical protein
MTTNHLCLFESRDSEAETIPDEDYNNLLGRNKKEVNSWHVGVSNRPKLNEGPNINLKYFKKKYDTEEEKHFITKKIRTKKKTELCKNWELYNDCYFKDECSFAHGIEELRTSNNLCGYKTKICKSFTEKSYCSFGQRCTYKHIIKEKRLLTYQSVLINTSNQILNELEKKENDGLSIIQIYQLFQSKLKLIIPRLEVFKNILKFRQNMCNN